MRHFYAHARKTHIIMYFFLFFESMWQDITVCFSSRSCHKQSGENTFVEYFCSHYVPKALKLDLSAFTFWYKLDSKQSSKVQSCSFWRYLSFDLYNSHISDCDWCEKAWTNCSFFVHVTEFQFRFYKKIFLIHLNIHSMIVHIWRKGIIKAVSGLAVARAIFR